MTQQGRTPAFGPESRELQSRTLAICAILPNGQREEQPIAQPTLILELQRRSLPAILCRDLCLSSETSF